MSRSTGSPAKSTARRETPLEESVKRLIRYSIGLYVVVILLGLGLGVVAYKSITSAHEANDALCTFRSDLEVRVASGRKFLDEHPEGLPKLGLTSQALAQSIRSQDRTVDSLSSLEC